MYGQLDLFANIYHKLKPDVFPTLKADGFPARHFGLLGGYIFHVFSQTCWFTISQSLDLFWVQPVFSIPLESRYVLRKGLP